MRIASGSPLAADSSHLHAETKSIPINEHLSMLCAQFLVSALRPGHPSHPLVTQDPGPRAETRKPLLQTSFLGRVSHLLSPEGTLEPSTYSSALRSIHTSSIRQYITSSPPNRILNTQPPAISPSESSLPREYRTTLSQLRSGHCSRLNEYRHRIGLSPSDQCPECSTSLHTVHHVFNCPAAPTALSIEDLWTRPRAVAEFLPSLSAFSALPPLDLQRPRPPPEPPPGGR